MNDFDFDSSSTPDDALPPNVTGFLDKKDKYGTKEDSLKFTDLHPGDELTVEVYPTNQNLEPEPLILAILEVTENEVVRAVARGGTNSFQEQEVRIVGSSISPNGSWFRNGMVDVDSFMELVYTDVEQGNKIIQGIRETFLKDGQIGDFNDEFFHEMWDNHWKPAVQKAQEGGEVSKGIEKYREFSGGEDPDMETQEGRANWITYIMKDRAATRKVLAGPIANFKVEKPASFDPTQIQKDK